MLHFNIIKVVELRIRMGEKRIAYRDIGGEARRKETTRKTKT
jgi:hypothetical protein